MIRHAIASAFIPAFVLTLVSTAVTVQADDAIFKIGMVVCLTGECAADGTGASEGARIAMDEINAAGGVMGRKISLVSQDTAEAISGARAMSAYRQLRLDSEIRYFIGPSWTPGRPDSGAYCGQG